MLHTMPSKLTKNKHIKRIKCDLNYTNYTKIIYFFFDYIPLKNKEMTKYSSNSNFL